MNQQRIDHCIEALCDKGCRAVWGHIQRLEAGEPLAETVDLTEQERQAVLKELKAVMAVYGEEGCRVDGDH
jgi:hypothetical protein